MGLRGKLDILETGLRRALRLLSRPATADRGRGGIVIQPYRGYGSRREVFLMGRVFRQQKMALYFRRPSLGRDLVNIGRRLLRQGVPGAVLTARFSGTKQEAVTDRDGYFRIHLYPAHPPPDRLWHRMDLILAGPAGDPCRTSGVVFIPPETARFVVISDIDDTVILTGVANKLQMMWRLFVQGARSRVAFPGVAAFYRALYGGRSGTETNPMLYVSRGPWTLYEILDEFFNLHRIPAGPILFLREWGLTPRRPLPRRAKGHKLSLIRDMLSIYDALPFILIGDSGQRDPEIYTQVVREHPGRVLAIYIRNVNRNPRRQRDIEELAGEVAEAGSTLLVAADSFAMAEHAAERGFISPEGLPEIIGELKEEQAEPVPKPVRRIGRPTPRETRRAVERGELAEALEGETGEESPPNVIVEPEEKDPPLRRTPFRRRTPRSRAK